MPATLALAALAGAALMVGEARRVEARPPSPPPLTLENALELLRTTETFADPHIGFAGEPSEEGCAFGAVIRRPEADRLFKGLLSEARPAGQLYALCGLYFTDPAAFRESVEAFRVRTDSVTTIQGCIVRRQPIAQIVEHTGPRAVRLTSPRDTLKQWLERNPDARQGFFSDIIGGGRPVAFKAMRPCRGIRMNVRTPSVELKD